jgi:hypothetical protein
MEGTTEMFVRNLARMVAVTAAAAGLAFSAASVASATTITNNVEGEFLSGYQVNNGLEGFNDVRGTIHLPASDPGPSSVYGQVAQGILLGENAQVGGYTAGLAFVFTGANTWTLEAGHNSSAGPASTAVNIADLTPVVPNIVLHDGQAFYLEIHYSTSRREIAFVAGPNEFGAPSDLGQASSGGPDISSGIPHGIVFEGPAAGVTATSGTVASNLFSGAVFGFTRDGLTKLLHPHAVADGTDSRLNMASQPAIRVQATEHGGASGVSNPFTLKNTLLGTQSGGAFQVTTP